MKIRLFAVLLCLFTAFAVAAFAEDDSVEADPQAVFLQWIELGFPDMDEVTDRAGTAAARTGIPKTEDEVTIRPDGSYVVVAAQENARFESAQPFGWIYFTQDYMAQQEQNDNMQDNIPAFMIKNGIHLLYQERVDFIDAYIGVSDFVGAKGTIVNLSDDDPRAEWLMLTLARQSGLSDYEIKTIGRHQYLVIRDFNESKGYVFYETVVNGIPFAAITFYGNALTPDSAAFFEDALSEISFSTVR